jgi:hypothetical protein
VKRFHRFPSKAASKEAVTTKVVCEAIKVQIASHPRRETQMAEEGSKPMELTAHEKFRTVSKILQNLEEDKKLVRDGQLPLETARVLQRYDYLQLKWAELNLKAIQAAKGVRGGNREMNLLTGAIEGSTVAHNEHIT